LLVLTLSRRAFEGGGRDVSSEMKTSLRGSQGRDIEAWEEPATEAGHGAGLLEEGVGAGPGWGFRQGPSLGFEQLSRCAELFFKRLQHGRPFVSRVRRFEGGKRGDFPHLNVILFGWSYQHKARLQRMWGDVTEEVTGVRAFTGLSIQAVGAGEVGRVGSYIRKEQLLRTGSYVFKESRPAFMPPRRRVWSKTPGLAVRCWPSSKSFHSSPLLPAWNGASDYTAGGAPLVSSSSAPMRLPLGGRAPPGVWLRVRSAAVEGSR
jgi:hypothetical protein